MPIAGHKSTLKISGDPVAMTTEACTLVSAAVAQVTSTSRQILDPATAITVYDNGVPQTSTDYVVDYLFGKVTKNSGSWTGPVTITGAYVPLLTGAEAVSVRINSVRAELDKTVMGDTVKSYILGLRSADGEMELLSLPSADLDTGGGTTILASIFDAATPKLLEVVLNPDASPTKKWRGWVVLTGLDQVAKPDDLFRSPQRWTASAIKGNGRSDYAAARFG